MKTARKKIKDELDKLSKEYIRIRDKKTCQHCGKILEGSNCHVSHVMPISMGDKLRWDFNNMKVLCFHCHMNWWHKNPIESGEWFKKKFPKRYKYLISNRGLKNFTFDDLIYLKEKLKSMDKSL